MWLRDYHVDGLRLDAVHAMHRHVAPCTSSSELADAVDALAAELGRRLVLIAESDLQRPAAGPAAERGGYGLDASGPTTSTTRSTSALTGERDGYYADFGSPGAARRRAPPRATSTRAGTALPAAAPRAARRRPRRPPRSSATSRTTTRSATGPGASGLPTSPAAAAARSPRPLVLTSPFVPLLFQGEEWAASAPFPYFADHDDDPELAEADPPGPPARVRRRSAGTPMRWPIRRTRSPSARPGSTVPSATGSHTPRCGAGTTTSSPCRTAEPSLRHGRFEDVDVAVDDDRGLLAYRLGDLAVAVNIGTEQATVPLPGAPSWAEAVLASDERTAVSAGAVELPPDSVAVVRTRPAPSEGVP